jgi:hypothetical protein
MGACIRPGRAAHRAKLRAMIETISDHMPVLSRFYFHERD